MALADGLLQLLEQCQPGVGDADLHDAAVVGHSLADDQAALLQPIDQPRDVRGVRDQPAGQHQRRQRARDARP